MKLKWSKDRKSLVVTGIMNESMMDDAYSIAAKSKCSYEQRDYGCTGVITGTKPQLLKYIDEWNK